MCVAIPAEILELLVDASARVNVAGVEKTISIVLLENLKSGDFVLVYLGFAVSKVDPDEARRSLDMLAEIGVNAADLVS